LRAVLDVNVLVAALLSPAGSSAALILRWLAGDFELVTSELLLAELARTLKHRKLRSRVTDAQAKAFIEILRSASTLAPDHLAPSRRSREAGDDYLAALAVASAAVLVTGDTDLLVLAPDEPVFTPASFLRRLTGE
jgi:putative PIN family toxin of toxin-antitoxin system